MMTVNRKELFLEATTGERWRTLDEVVEDLDLAGYWPYHLTDATKREHVREMIATLKFSAASPPQLAGMNKFVSLQQRRSAGAPIRVYKQFGECTLEELDEIIKQSGASEACFRRFRRRLREAAALLEKSPRKAAGILLEELTESTMQRAWGEDKTLEDRRTIVACGLLLYLSQEGTDQRLGSVREKSRAHLRPTNRLHEGFIHLLESKLLYYQEEMRWYSAEFADVLNAAAKVEFGWTLDEHLGFTVEGR
jgi:hypothetical protein